MHLKAFFPIALVIRVLPFESIFSKSRDLQCKMCKTKEPTVNLLWMMSMHANITF